MEPRVELVLAILEACDEEGEDLPFSRVLELVRASRPDLASLTGELASRYGDLPPRVALARMAHDPAWREAVREASEIYLASSAREDLDQTRSSRA